MLHSFSTARRSRQIAVLVGSFGALAVVAGCGGSGGEASAPASTPTLGTTDPTTQPPTSPGQAQIAPSKDIPQHVTPTGVPKGARPLAPTDASKQNSLKPPTAADKLIVSSAKGKKPVWRVSARASGNDVVCVTVSSLGASLPDPDCETGTQLALEFLTSAGPGPGIARVAEIQRSVRNPPSDVLISGATSADVRTVYVEYRHKKYKADLSKHTVSLPVKVDNVKAIAGAEGIDNVPNPIPVKVFGVSLPKVNGNPPTTATLKGRHPKKGAITFALS